MTTQVYMLTKLLLVSSGIICHVHVCSHGQSSKTKKKKEERGTKGGSVVGLESRIILEALCKCVEKSGVETSETCLPILAKRSAPYVWS